MTPSDLTPKAALAAATAHAVAVAKGCRPEWYNGILGWAWHCTCRDGRHACDQQCSAITLTSAWRAR